MQEKGKATQTFVPMFLQPYLLTRTTHNLLPIPSPNPALVYTPNIKRATTPLITPKTAHQHIAISSLVNPLPRHVNIWSILPCKAGRGEGDGRIMDGCSTYGEYHSII